MRKVITTVVLIIALVPNSFAQNTQEQRGGLFGFGSNTDQKELLNNGSILKAFGLFNINRDVGGLKGEISNEDFDETSPLGNGVLFFVTMSVGYTILKRKEDKK